MWDKIEVLTYAGLLLVALWIFRATYRPLRAQVFGRPVGPRVVIAMRLTALLAAGLCLVALAWDVFFR